MMYCDLATGIAGARPVLDGANASCVFSCETDGTAATVYSSLFSSCAQADARIVNPDLGPRIDAVFCRIPPLLRGAWIHRGRVDTGLWGVIDRYNPGLVVLESGRGLLNDRFGYSMAALLEAFTRRTYSVAWLRVNATAVGVPHDRSHTFVIAMRGARLDQDSVGRTIGELWEGPSRGAPSSSPIEFGTAHYGALSEVLAARMPRLGMSRPKVATPFRSFGVCQGDFYVVLEGRLARQIELHPSLGEVVAPQCDGDGSAIVAVRLVSRGGRRGVLVKRRRASYALGKGVSAGPLFAVPFRPGAPSIGHGGLAQFANWFSERDGMNIVRITPERAVMLYGEGLADIAERIRVLRASAAKKYELVATLVPPALLRVALQNWLPTLLGRCAPLLGRRAA